MLEEAAPPLHEHVFKPQVRFTHKYVATSNFHGFLSTFSRARCSSHDSANKPPSPVHCKVWGKSLNVHVMGKFDETVVKSVGFLVGPSHVLTASCTVYSQLTSKFADSVAVVVGRLDVPVARAFSPPSWLSGRGNVNVSMLVLCKPIGKKVGWGAMACNLPRGLPCTLTTAMCNVLEFSAAVLADVADDSVTLQPAPRVEGVGLVWLPLQAPPVAAFVGVCLGDAATAAAAAAGPLRAVCLSAALFQALVAALASTYRCCRADADADAAAATVSAHDMPPLESVIVAAAGGDAQGQFLLGRLYHRGVEVLADVEKAKMWLTRACDGGSVEARCELGAVREGEGALVEATGLYESAARAGVQAALLPLARLLARGGPGLPPDPVRAAHYFEAAARAGVPEAMVALAHMHLAGVGVGVDMGRACALYAEAARAGCAEAQVALGRLLLAGEAGVQSRNPTAALEFFRLAAQQGDAAGLEAVAIMLLRGDGVTADPAEATIWLERAASAGSAQAAAWLDSVAPKQARRQPPS